MPRPTPTNKTSSVRIRAVREKVAFGEPAGERAVGSLLGGCLPPLAFVVSSVATVVLFAVVLGAVAVVSVLVEVVVEALRSLKACVLEAVLVVEASEALCCGSPWVGAAIL